MPQPDPPSLGRGRRLAVRALLALARRVAGHRPARARPTEQPDPPPLAA